jgi:hypothetical protein
MIETCGASRSLARRVLFPGVAQGCSASVDKRRDTFVAGVVERAQHEVAAGDVRSGGGLALIFAHARECPHGEARPRSSRFEGVVAVVRLRSAQIAQRAEDVDAVGVSALQPGHDGVSAATGGPSLRTRSSSSTFRCWATRSGSGRPSATS